MPRIKREVALSEGENDPVDHFQRERRSGICHAPGAPKTIAAASSLSDECYPHHN